MGYTLNEGERFVGTAFGAPLVVKGWTWFPANQIILWAVMTWAARREHPHWSWSKNVIAGALSMSIILGSEWLHNLAHAATARWIGKPADALRIFMGMPLMIYRDESASGVTPREHIQRALGGPLFNACLLALAAILKQFTRPGSIARFTADAAVGMNTFLATMSLMPIPGIDGGSVLKWALVQRGVNPQAADKAVVRANRVTAAGLGLAAGLAFKQRRWLAGGIFSLFSVLSLVIGFGILKEKHTHTAEKI